MIRLRTGLLAACLVALLPRTATTGSFIGAGEGHEDRILHQNYFGSGGALGDIKVCVDISVNSALAIAAEPAVRNVIATYNRFHSLPAHTQAMWPDTSAEQTRPDFETVLLHEFMHVHGLDHPQHANNPALEGASGYPYDATRSTGGANGVLDHPGDPDGVPGSADDQRGDDVNLNWYVRGSNDPGVLPAVVDTTTMARTLDGLPAGHQFAANGNTAVMAALGRADSESAAHQGHEPGQVQRHLHHEDVATLRLARAGIDGIAGTADDYRSEATYAGRYHDPQGGECNAVVRFDDSVAFASTLVGTTPIAPGHLRLIYPTRMRFNPLVDWYFTPGANTAVQIVDTPDPSEGDDAYSVQVTVAKAAYNTMGGEPVGEVVVRDGPRDDAQTATCRFTLVAGTGSCQITPRVAGRRTLTADYLGWGGWDGGSATTTHDVRETLAFSAITHTPEPSVVGAEVTIGWTLAAGAGALPVTASGTVTVKQASDCASPPDIPAHQCAATLPADSCRFSFTSSGIHALQLCYSGDAVFAAANASITHQVDGGRVTSTTLLSASPAVTAPFEPYSVQVQVRETPDLGGHPQGSVIVRDGPAGDPLTSACAVTLAGVAGETASCALAATRAGPRTLTAEYSAQGMWAASSASAVHTARRLAIASHLPASSAVGEAVSVVVDLDVRPFLDGPAPTGSVIVSDGVDSCTIVLPATRCVWRGSLPGPRGLTASWAGDGNYAAATSATVIQTVVAALPAEPRLLSTPIIGHAESTAASSASGQGLSADGRFLVFTSSATDLVAGDGNGVDDVFLRDQQNGALRLVSAAADGTPGNAASASPSISANGRYVAFASASSNLLAGDGSQRNVFVKDLHTGQLVRASSLADGSPAPGAESVHTNLASSLSADGRFVAFATIRALLAGDTNGRVDVYVRDLATGALDLVSSNSEDLPGDNHSHIPAISADGRHVAYLSTAGNLIPDFTANSLQNRVFVKDRLSRVSRMASSTAAGEPASGPGGCGDTPAISAAGRYVAFQCYASNLLPGQGWGGERVFVKDLDSGVLELVSQGGAFNNALAPAISADGRYVVFQQGQVGVGVGVFVRDRQTGTVANQHLTSTGAAATEETVSWEPRLRPAISGDGRFVAFRSVSPRLVAHDLNGVADVFVRDRTQALTQRASAAFSGVRNNGDSNEASVSRDGGAVVFASTSSALVAGDGNGVSDIFLHDIASGSVLRVSTSGTGAEANGASFSPAYAADTGEVAFLSAASNLVSHDTNGKVDLFVKNLGDGSVRRLSTSFGAQNTADALGPVAISRDGRNLVFTAADYSQFLGSSGDRNGYTDIIRLERYGPDSYSHTILSAAAGPTLGNGHSAQATLSDDGQVAVFASDATNLVADGGTPTRDVFAAVSATHGSPAQFLLASSDAGGSPGNGHSEQPALSPDGRYVAFVSDASNLVAGDGNGQRDVFLKDLQTGTIERLNTSSSGGEGTGGGCSAPSVGTGGRHVGFVCAQDGLLAGSAAGVAQYFVKDRSSGALVRLSESAAGIGADAGVRAGSRSLADDGRAVFASNARTLTGLATTALSNVFAHRFTTTLAASTTAISSTDPGVPQAGFDYTVNVTVSSGGGSTATGRVRVVGAQSACMAVLTPGSPSTGSCALRTSSTGAYSLTAYYGGDASTRASASTGFPVEVPHLVLPGEHVITQATPGNGRVTLELSVNGRGTPHRRYIADCGGVEAETSTRQIVVQPLANGVAVQCTARARNDLGDGPASAPVSVTPIAATSTSLSVAEANPWRVNAAYQVTAAVSGEGSPAPGGQVTISDGSSSCVVPLAAGTPSLGSCALTATARGSRTLSASYAGDVANLGSSGSISHSFAEVPGAPTLVSATRGNAQVSLVFSAPADTGGNAISQYTARCGTQSVSGAASPLVVAGLVNGIAVDCDVSARNAVGAGAASNTLSATPLTTPAPPTLTAVQPGDTRATVHFNAATSDGGSPIVSYRVLCGARFAVVTASPALIEGLSNGVQVNCFALTRTAANLQSAVSNVIVTTPRPLPGAPTLTSATAGDASATLHFDPPPDAATALVQDYSARCGTQTATGTTSPLTVTGLGNGATVDCSVAARNPSGAGAASNVIAVTPRTVPQAPVLVAVAAGDGQATLSFDAPTDDGGSPIDDYTARCGAQSTTGPGSPLVVTGLANGVEVACQVSARNVAGSSALSATQRVTPRPGIVAPGAPTLLAATPGNAQATLAFTAPADDGGSAIIDYTARCGDVSIVGAGSPIVVAPLGNGVPVSCQVSARNSAHGGAASNSLSVTPFTTPASPVLTAATRGDARVTLQFSAPDDDGVRPVLDYTARCGAVSVVGAGSPLSVAPLVNGSVVDCQVQARNAAGVGALSNALSARPATVPGAPVIDSLVGLPAGARVAFVAPGDTGGEPIVDYIATCLPGPLTAVGSGSPIEVGGLVAQQSYRCGVRARNAVGEGAPSLERGVIPGDAGSTADLAISKSNGSSYINDVDFVDYLITVRNLGPAAVVGARVVDPLAPDFADAAWTCEADAGAWCPAHGSGALDIAVDLPAQKAIRVRFAALPAVPGLATPISNTATVAAPAGLIDPVPGNNSATDGPDRRRIFSDGIEPRTPAR